MKINGSFIKGGKKLNSLFKVKQVFILDFSNSYTGTIKDMKTEEVLSVASKKGVRKIIIISSGNAAYSLGKLANKTNREVFAVVDKNLRATIKDKLQKVCKEVKAVDLESVTYDKKTLLKLFHLTDEEVLEASNGFHKAYGQIIESIQYSNFDFIVLPYGSGELFYGLLCEIKRLQLKTKLIGITPKQSHSYADKLTCKFSPYGKRIYQGLDKRHKVISVSESEIRKSFFTAKKFMKCEPSSGIVFCVQSKFNFPKDSKILFINTGKGIVNQ